jgi:hypothetical protein
MHPRAREGIPAPWVAKVEANPEVRYRELVSGLAGVVRRRAERAERYLATVKSLE